MANAEGSIARAAAQALRRFPRLYSLARRSYTRINELLPSRAIEGIPGPVHRNDLMREAGPGSIAAYVSLGREAVSFVRDALEDVGGKLGASSVLDFGCGYGRIVRHFVKEARSVTACDLDHEAVRFCARAFGAIPVFGSSDITKVALARYDAVWLGSVLTHLPPDVCSAVLRELSAHLNDGGILIATSNDRSVLDAWLLNPRYVWMRPQAERLLDELDRTGATYAHYPQSADGSYGLGFQTDQWLDRAITDAGLLPLWHRTAAWDFQSVHAGHLPQT